MKILGEELGKNGRWYIALPPLLLIGFLIGLFLLAEAGQSRIATADLRIHGLEKRGQALGEILALISDAESEQRGYLLTGEESYLRRYAAAAAGVEPALDRLGRAYGPEGETRPELRRLRELARDKLTELDETVALYRKSELSPEQRMAWTDSGRRTTELVMASAAVLRQKQAEDQSAAAGRWWSELRVWRWISLGGFTLNIALVALAITLVYRDMRRRARRATDLHDQKLELASLVDERTRELTALSTRLQEVSEIEKAALSRELHDELGTLLVAARMDLSWLQQRVASRDPAVEQRFKRVHESLNAGMEMKRRVVEELRPTLLDNMGLYSALRWQFRESCKRKGLIRRENIPETEINFNPDASIGVFRVAQEALTNILKHAEARSAELGVEIEEGLFVLRVWDDGRGIPADRLHTITSHGLASMRHRVMALGGSLDIGAPSAGGTTVTVRIPLSRMLRDMRAEPQSAA